MFAFELKLPPPPNLPQFGSMRYDEGLGSSHDGWWLLAQQRPLHTGKERKQLAGGEEKHESVILSNTAKTVCRWEAAVQHFYKESIQNIRPSGEPGQATGKQSRERLPLQASTPWPCPGLAGSPVSSEPGEGGPKGSISASRDKYPQYSRSHRQERDSVPKI